MRPGPRNLITDVDGLRVGNAQDDGLKSGVTVLTADAPLTAAVHVMGGAPGTRETALLAPDKMVQAVDALVLSGGSAFGLAACDGVMEGLLAAGRGFAVGTALVPIVPGAILFDLLNGGDKGWAANPYPGLGRAALDGADAVFALGSAGAGTGALTLQWKGGLGSASAVLEGGATIGALVAVNALGSVTAPDGRRFWAAPWEMGSEFGGLGLGGLLLDLRADLVHVQVLDGVDHLVEGCGRQGTRLREDEDALAERHEGGDGGDLGRCGEPLLGLGVHLAEHDLGVLLGRGLVGGGELLARSAPLRPPVQQDDVVVGNGLAQGVLGDVNGSHALHTRSPPRVVSRPFTGGTRNARRACWTDSVPAAWGPTVLTLVGAQTREGPARERGLPDRAVRKAPGDVVNIECGGR